MDIPKGRPKSGRIWKSENKRFSSMKKDKSLKSNWKTKMKLKMEMKLVKSQAKELKDLKLRETEERKQRRRDNIKRKEENEMKSQIVQVIRNSAKIKRMKKKQLRNIRKQ